MFFVMFHAQVPLEEDVDASQQERMGLTPDWIISVSPDLNNLIGRCRFPPSHGADRRRHFSAVPASFLGSLRQQTHPLLTHTFPLDGRQSAAFSVFGLQPPNADVPYIEGLLDPCTNSKAAPNIPAEKLYDREACYGLHTCMLRVMCMSTMSQRL